MALGDAEELDKRRMRREELRYKRQQEQKKLIIGLVVAVVLLAISGVGIYFLSRTLQPPAPTEPPETLPPETVGATPEATEAVEQTQPSNDTVIHIAAAGDLNVTDRTVDSGGENYDYVNAFRDVVPLLSEADLTLMNFEGNLCGAPYGTEYRSAPQSMVQALSLAGVDLVQMANSCAIVNGTIGLGKTLEGLRAAGLEPLGAYSSNDEARRAGGYTIRTVEGVKIAFVAFTKGMDGMGLPEGSENCVNLLYTDYATTYQKVNTDGITKVIRAASREKPDIIIALLHWGSEYNDNRSDTQDDIRDLLLGLGVDAIIGTHPHYVQSIEYDEAAGTLVAYSLGDFFSDAERAGSEYSIVLDLEITKDSVTGAAKITGYSYTPIFTVAEEGKPARVVRLAQGIREYESNYVDKVLDETYSDMVYAQTRIEERVKPVAEEED